MDVNNVIQICAIPYECVVSFTEEAAQFKMLLLSQLKLKRNPISIRKRPKTRGLIASIVFIDFEQIFALKFPNKNNLHLSIAQDLRANISFGLSKDQLDKDLLDFYRHAGISK